MGEAILEVKDLTKQFGGLTAVDSVSVSFEEDSLYAIIGPNGAGKTTFFNLLTGVLQPTSGSIHFQGGEITGLNTEEIAQRGMVRSYQITSLFDNLTTLENVRVAVQTKYDPYDFWTDIDDDPEMTDRAMELLKRVGLEHRSETPAANLSHGEQRTLEIAVTLGTDPSLLLLDEPSSGMSPEETTEMIGLLGELSADLPIVLIEHKMNVVRQVADYIMVLHKGRKIADGTPEKVGSNEQVKRVYLGTHEI